MKLPYPFDYYWKKYLGGKCPFCGSEEIYTFENYDVIRCSIYGGYLSLYQDEAFAGPNGDGPCKECMPTSGITSDAMGEAFVKEVEDTSPFQTVAEGQGFVCENCGHGVDFERVKAFQILFEKHDEDECRHCKWHNGKSPQNRVEKPSN